MEGHGERTDGRQAKTVRKGERGNGKKKDKGENGEAVAREWVKESPLLFIALPRCKDEM